MLGWQVDGAVGTLTLDRPPRKNALTFEMYAELRDTFRRLASNDDLHAVVLHGAGENFCSGGDVRDIIGHLVQMDLPQKLRFTQMTGDVLKAMRHCPQPIVAAVDGVCMGAGAMLAMGADLRLGTSRARVAFLFNRVGLSGADMGACAILPRIIGHGRAAELLFTGRELGAEEAARWGFFNRLCAPEVLLSEAQALARSLAEGLTFANTMTKRMLHKEWDMDLDEAIDSEAQAQAMCMQTADFAEAYAAFMERRPPRFTGS